MENRSANRKPTPRKRPSVKQQGRLAQSVRQQAQEGVREESQERSSLREGRSARQSTQQPRIQMPDVSAAFASNKKLLLGAACALVVLVLGFGIASALGGKKSDGTAINANASASTSAQAEAEPTDFSVSFTTTGDLIFWREVADFIDMNGGAAAMEGIADLLDDADVTISNLESPLSTNESEPVPAKDVYIIGRPEGIEGMKNSGIDIVSLANNHIADYTGPALQDTLDALDAAGIKYAGAGMTEAAADAVLETEVNGASIAFISWTDIVPDYFVAFGGEPGVASARLNMDAALKKVKEAKATHDIVIVAMHWGIEYQDYADEDQQVTPAHQLVDAGADVVLGNHPHVLQGIEFYKDSLIAYAHGNCVFRQSFDVGYTHESYVMHFDITQDGIQNLRVTPLYLSDEHGIPSVATGEQAQFTLNRLAEVSDGMNTAFDIQGDLAYVRPLSASSANATNAEASNADANNTDDGSADAESSEANSSEASSSEAESA